MGQGRRKGSRQSGGQKEPPAAQGHWQAAGLGLVVLGALAACIARFSTPSAAAAAVPSSLFDTSVSFIEGNRLNWAPLAGKRVFLFANVASQCGYTHPGYEQLNALDNDYRTQGLVILAAPCNQFGGQEPGSSAEILTFARMEMDSKFSLLEKMNVNGPNAHPLYKFLRSHPTDDCVDSKPECPGWAEQGECVSNPDYMRSDCQKSCGCPVLWNFEYFLVDANGDVLRRYRTGTDVTSPQVREHIERALADVAPHVEL